MFEALIVKPIFNLLVFIYAALPGHNFGLSIIIFTVAVRFLMWPLIRKQLYHAKAMRALQPELKRIKKAAAGDRQKESMMMMQLYKEREISPFGSLGILVVQLVILIGLYSGLRRVVDHPQAIVDYAYPWLQNMSWMQELASNIRMFDATLLGVVDLTKSALPPAGGIYWPAMLLVAGSAVAQYFQSKQLMPDDKGARGLKQILREASSGKQADAGEMNAAVSRSMRFLIPGMIFLFTVNLPSALSLYWVVSGITAYLQQAYILRQDTEEMEAQADKADAADARKQVIEGEVIEAKTPKKKKSSKKSSTKPNRRKK